MDAGPLSEADGSARSAVKSLRKALSVLNAVAAADRPLTVAEVALHAGIARPTAYRFVQTLVAEGSLAQDASDGRLSIGFAVLPLAASLLDRNRMRIEALPHLNTLAQQSGERANLGSLIAIGSSTSPAWRSRRCRPSIPGSARLLRPLLLARKGDTRLSARAGGSRLAGAPAADRAHAREHHQPCGLRQGARGDTAARLRVRPRRARARFLLPGGADLRCPPSTARRDRRERARARASDQASSAGAAHGGSHLASSSACLGKVHPVFPEGHAQGKFKSSQDEWEPQWTS